MTPPTQTTQPPLTITTIEAAKRLSISPASIRRLIKSGRLPSLKLGAALRIRVTDLEALIANAG